MKTLFVYCAAAFVAVLAWTAPAATTRYVDLNSANPVSPFTSWSTAATNIQNAVDLASAGDLILVTNGVYQSGSQANSGANRVNIWKAVTVQSVNGPAATEIVGAWDAATNGPNSVRCAYLIQNTKLSGFLLAGGSTIVGQSGGGVLCADATAVVTNCVISGNAAYTASGGIYRGTAIGCSIVSNIVVNGGGAGGGGANSSTLYNCLVAQNFSGYSGGGANGSTLVNCTVVSNVAATYAAAGWNSTFKNCIVYYNNNYYTNADNSGDYGTWSNCCSSSLPGFGANNFTNPPQFVDFANGDYHLMPSSPCVNAGVNGYITNSIDLDGNPRVVGAKIDLGAYEYQAQHFVNLGNANPVTPFTSWSTAATNIQDAIDASVAGDLVIVTNGTYSAGSRAVYGSQKFRVAITKAITVQSLNGPATVNILCPPPTAVQMPGVYLTNGAVLSGVTVSNGNAVFGSGGVFPQYGGGVWCESSSAVVTNCWLTHNAAPQNGGGAFRGTLLNCVLTNNSAEFGGGACSNILINCTLVRNTSTFVSSSGVGGGGAIYSSLSNCVLAANSANNCMGGGASWSMLNNCAVSNNYAGANGGGLFQCIANNSLISSNRAVVSGGGVYQGTLQNCLIATNYAGNNGGGFSGGGGGVYGAALTGCLVSNNVVFYLGYGGGVNNCQLTNCVLIGNGGNIYGGSIGGGAYGSVLNSCLVISNNAQYGGGANNSALNNCTIVRNYASAYGGGVGGIINQYGSSNSILNNCIIYSNSMQTTPGQAGTNYYGDTLNYCCTWPLPTNGMGNFTNPPAFVNWVNGNYHLQSNSPCINSGNNAAVVGSTDLDGNARISGGTVDMGAYEIQNPPSVISYAWLQQYGLPTDGSMDYTNLDGTGFNVYQDWVAGLNPTNPASVLAMSSAVSTNSANGITVTWQSVNNRTYYLQRSSDLTASFSTIQSNIIGQAVTTSYMDTSATNAVPYFYRVGVQ